MRISSVLRVVAAAGMLWLTMATADGQMGANCMQTGYSEWGNGVTGCVEVCQIYRCTDGPYYGCNVCTETCNNQVQGTTIECN